MSERGNGKAPARGQRAGAVALRRHLEHLKLAELKEVHAFWAGDEGTDAGRAAGARAAATKADLLVTLERLMAEEGTVHRRVRALTRKVLDVLLLLLKREHYASDLPGLFRRLPGEDPVRLEYHEAEAGLKALLRRGFVAEVSDRSMAGNGRVIYTVPVELGETLTGLFRDETRRVAGVFSLGRHLAAITAAERAALREVFPALAPRPEAGEAEALLAAQPVADLFDRLPADLRAVVEYAIERHGGVMRRAAWQRRTVLPDLRWERKRWCEALERAGLGTVARLNLTPYGLLCEDDTLVVFEEALAARLGARDATGLPAGARVLGSGCDLIADLCAFLEHVRRNPLKVSRDGEVYKAGRRRLEEGFVFRESFLAGPPEVWAEIMNAVEHLGLVAPDAEGFLELKPATERFLLLPLEEKVRELYRIALDQGGPRGRSLHQHEQRVVLAERLREQPRRWWHGRSLAVLVRHRYLRTLDERGIQERYRDRHFSAWFSGTETPDDLLDDLDPAWLTRMWRLGMLEAAVQDERVRAWRLSALGARVLGAEVPEIETGLTPLLVNPDFEVLVLPEGDVSDVVHTLDGWAQRTKTDDVVHFRLTKESVEGAVGAGRAVDAFLAFLEARARGGVPQNVRVSVGAWAGAVTFATLERGVLLKAADEMALERILSFAAMQALLVRRLGPSEALLKSEPTDRKLLAALRERGIELEGP